MQENDGGGRRECSSTNAVEAAIAFYWMMLAAKAAVIRMRQMPRWYTGYGCREGKKMIAAGAVKAVG